MKSKIKTYLLTVFFVIVIIVSVLGVALLIILDNPEIRDKFLSNFEIERIAVRANEGSSSSSLDKNSKSSSKVDNPIIEKTHLRGKSYLDDVLFIGDSRIVGLKNMGHISAENMLAEVGLAHTEALTKNFDQDGYSYTIEEYLNEYTKDVIVIAFGINGISYMNKDKFMSSYSELIDTVKELAPNSKIVIESILPIGEILENRDSKYNNEKIEEYNQDLIQMCKDKGIKYLNVYECMIDEDTGYLIEDFDSGDGLHFNKTAYDEIVNYILTHTV